MCVRERERGRERERKRRRRSEINPTSEPFANGSPNTADGLNEAPRGRGIMHIVARGQPSLDS